LEYVIKVLKGDSIAPPAEKMRRTNSRISAGAAATFTLEKLPREKRLEQFHKEYTKICTIDADPRVDFSTSLEFCYLNRYSNILANEQTLFPPSSDPSLYINANRMPFETPHTLIAAQAPISDEGLIPWWRVIMSYKISLVLMLTREIENHVPKADRYWPSEVHESEQHGPFRVVLESEEHFPELMVKLRRLSVVDAEADSRPCHHDADANVHQRSEKVHTLIQVQYLGWPDHGIPTSTAAFRHMIERIEQHPTAAPVLVHCSAGIGRTGTLIGYYVVRHILMSGKLTDRTVYDTVCSMKRSRRGMVQRFDQYHFIYQCLFEELASRGKDPGSIAV
jgi:protein tyrosine phosphatase